MQGITSKHETPVSIQKLFAHRYDIVSINQNLNASLFPNIISL